MQIRQAGGCLFCAPFAASTPLEHVLFISDLLHLLPLAEVIWNQGTDGGREISVGEYMTHALAAQIHTLVFFLAHMSVWFPDAFFPLAIIIPSPCFFSGSHRRAHPRDP